MRTARTSSGAILCAGLIAAAPVGAQSVRVVGSEFQVNTYTPDYQRRAAIASEDNGDFVVVWQSPGQDASGLGVFGQRFSSTGSRLGAEFQANLHVTANQWAPSVAMDQDGDFVAVWHDGSAHDGSGYGVFGRRYASSGAAIGGEFQINTYTLGTQSYPAVAMDGSGRFIVAWQSDIQDGALFGIFEKHFNSDGTPSSLEYKANIDSQGNQVLPAVAMNDAGAFVIAWESTAPGLDGNGYGIVAAFVNSSGTVLAEDVVVNLSTPGDQRSPAVAVTGDGRFVVAWRGALEDVQSYGVYARRFNIGGLGYEEVQVNLYTTSAQSDPSVAAADDDNGFVVAWTSNGQDDSSDGIFARRFSSLGVTLAPDFQINSSTEGRQYRPAIALGDGGAFVVAWEDTNDRDGSESAIVGRRGRALPMFDFDGDGTVAPLTDGLLLVRWMFGFSGEPLTAGVVGAACSRCSPAAIDSYLDQFLSMSGLDIDDDGVLGALTDGLLVLRYLFGFRDAVLEAGAVSQNCDRCTADSIEPFIAARVAL